jgi:hypothetical protein
MTLSDNRSDAVIVGAGIASSALAIALARSGFSVTLLEKSAVHVDRVRGEFIVPWGVAEARTRGDPGPARRRGRQLHRPFRSLWRGSFARGGAAIHGADGPDGAWRARLAQSGPSQDLRRPQSRGGRSRRDAHSPRRPHRGARGTSATPHPNPVGEGAHFRCRCRRLKLIILWSRDSLTPTLVSPHSRSGPAHRIPSGRRRPASLCLRGFAQWTGSRNTTAGGSWNSSCRSTIPVLD